MNGDCGEGGVVCRYGGVACGRGGVAYGFGGRGLALIELNGEDKEDYGGRGRGLGRRGRGLTLTPPPALQCPRRP